MKQPVRKQVRLYTLLIYLRLAGPCHLPKPEPKPIPHTVLDNQPLEHINFTHIYLQLVVCMYTSRRIKSARRENCQPKKEVKHQHKGRTSVSRHPLAKQGISSQDSSYSEAIGLFTRNPCKFHLKSDLRPTIHASQKQEIPLQVNTENVNTHWVHSYRMEHAKHFPAPMEMCMDDHLTQTTERTQ